jgi:hypothetical protein
MCCDQPIVQNNASHIRQATVQGPDDVLVDGRNRGVH